jgi:hypothetical protein
MASFNKFNSFVDYLCKAGGAGGINMNTDAIYVGLTNSAPVATNTVWANITDIGTANGYTTGGAQAVAQGGTSVSNSSGTETMAVPATTWTSTTGTMGPFRYIVYYDFTATSPVTKPLIGWYDYGSALSLNGANGDTFTITPSGGALFTLA